MKARTLFLLTTVALLVVPGLSIAAVTGSPSLSVQFTDDTVTPGEETTIGLVVVNEGDVDSGSAANPALNDQVTTARGLTAKVNSGGGPFSVITGRQAIGTLPEGASKPITFNVAIDEDAEPGNYRVPVHVSYKYTSYVSETSGAQESESISRTLETKLTVEDGANLNVVDVESDARVGSTGTVAVTVENTGTLTANDTRFTLTSQSGDVTFGKSNAATRHVGTWEPGERKTIRYEVTAADTANAGNYSFTLEGTYSQANGRTRTTDTAVVGVETAPEQSFSIDQVESTLAVGDDGNLSGVVTNEGNQSVRNVVLTWSSEQRNVNPTETEYAVGNLGPGESATFDFDVEVSDAARSGPRQFSFVANYDTAEGDQRASDPIAVRQQVAPASDEFDVEIVHANVSAGGSSQIELRITNALDEPVTDVTAALFADSPITTGDDQAFVDRLGPGESVTLRFSLSAGASALDKPYPLSMDFQYDEPDGDTITSDTYSVPVQVNTSSGGGGLPLGMIGGVALLAVVGVGAFTRFR